MAPKDSSTPRKGADESSGDELEEAREQFSKAEDGWADAKNAALDDLQFGMLGVQWPPDVEQERLLDGRPCLTINDLPASVRQVVNDGRQNRPSIKVRPMDSGADVRTAEIYSGLIKNIEAMSNADVAYDTALDRAASMGFGFGVVEADYGCENSFDLDLKICPVMNPLAVSWDPTTEAMDSSDWNYCFISEMVDKEIFQRDYPGAESDGTNFADDTYLSSWYQDDQIRVARWWRRTEEEGTLVELTDGTVLDAETYTTQRAVFDAIGATVARSRKTKRKRITLKKISGKDVLEETSWRGSVIPVVPCYGECLNVEGRRYFKSLIRDAKDAQRMFNLSRSTVSEIIGRTPKTPWLGEEGVFDTDDAEKWGNIHLKAWPYVQYKRGMKQPERAQAVQYPEGIMADAMAAADDKRRIIGVHAVGLGQPDARVISGVAKRMERAEGDTGTFHFIDNQNTFIRGLGTVLLEMIPQVYSGKRILRIIGDDGIPKNVPINQPIAGPQGWEKAIDLCAGKYDLTVEAGPSYTTRREEAAETLSTFITAVPQAAPILGPLMVKMMDFPDQEKTVRLLTTLMPPEARAIMENQPPPAPQPPPEVAMEQAKAQANFALQKQKAELDAQLEQQKAQNRTQIEQQQAQADIAVMQMKAQAEIEIERQKAQVQFQLKREEAKLAAELKIMGAAQAAQNTAAPGVQ